MSEAGQPSQSGWQITQSIAIELDTLLAVLNDQFVFGAVPAHVLPLLEQTPADWLAELPEMVGGLKGFFGLLTHIANWAGVLESGDYSSATLAMRQMSARQAVSHLGVDLPQSVENVDAAQRLVDLHVDAILEAERGVSLLSESVSAQRARYQQEAGQAARFLQGGDLSTRFWHWLDRFYYQVYQSWRESQLESMREVEQHALTVLGSPQNDGTPPQTDWLPAQNPLVNRPGLNAAVNQGDIKVIFWIEPFGLVDLWTIFPGKVITAIAQPGVLLENFFNFASQLAARAQALADPTRLVILRMIRHFAMTNTEIAAYLGISRPTVSVHAKILREAGLIDTYEVGRAVQHKIEPAALRKLFEDLIQFLDLPEE